MTDPRHIRGATSRNVGRPQWIWVAVAFLAGVLVLVGWGQLRNDPAGVQLTLKNIDERLGRIEQTLNDVTSSGRFSRADPTLPNPTPNRALSESSPKFYLNETEVDLVRQSLQQRRNWREGTENIASGSFWSVLQ